MTPTFQMHQFMTSRFGIPQSNKSRPQQSILNLISGCSLPLRHPFVTMRWTRDTTVASWSPSTCFSLLPPSFKSIQLISSPQPDRQKTDEGTIRTHTNAFHLLQVNSNWLLTFTYHQTQRYHSKSKATPVFTAPASCKHIPSETYLILHVSFLLGHKGEESDFVIKSITLSWLKQCSFHCLPCEGGKPLVPEWYFGQASSISEPPLGVIIAVWNCRCWMVIRSHVVSLSPVTLMTRISHPNKRQMREHECRTGLQISQWHRWLLYLWYFVLKLSPKKKKAFCDTKAHITVQTRKNKCVISLWE